MKFHVKGADYFTVHRLGPVTSWYVINIEGDGDKFNGLKQL
jgi:hypothetical protein